MILKIWLARAEHRRALIARSRERLVERYRALLDRGDLRSGGLWNRDMREKMVGIIRDYGGREGSNTTADFWQTKRDSVRTTLFDLELFIKAGSDSDLELVWNAETLQPIFESLFYDPVVMGKGPDLNRSEIAYLMFKAGFDYLTRSSPDEMTLPHKRTEEEALDLSKHLINDLRRRLKKR